MGTTIRIRGANGAGSKSGRSWYLKSGSTVTGEYLVINGHTVGHIKAGMEYPSIISHLACSAGSKISSCFPDECASFGKGIGT